MNKAETLLALAASLAATVAAIVNRGLGALSPKRRRLRRDQVREEVRGFRSRLKPLSVDVIEEAYMNGGGNAERLLSEMPKRESLSGINREAISVLAENLFRSIDDAAVTIGRRAEGHLRREGLRQAASQITGELPETEAASQLRRRLEEKGVEAFVDKAGRRWSLDNYTRMVVRTTTAEAQSYGVVAKMLERGFDLIEVIGHGCRHHPRDPNHPCRKYEGRVFSLTGQTPGYDRLPSLPPFHPACTHAVAPAVDAVSGIAPRVAA